MPIFYVSLYYNYPDGADRPYRPEFHIEAETFSEAAAKARAQMRTDYPGEVPDNLFVAHMGWQLPGVRTPSRLK